MRDMAFQQVDSCVPVEGRFKVYNFHCPPEARYFANSLLVANCSFCAYRMSDYASNQLFALGDLAAKGTNNPKRMMDFDKVQEIIDDCKEMGVGAIQLTGGGEPTVHPRFQETCEQIIDLDMDLGLVTNGLLLKEGTRELLMDASWVRVSIDAGTPETYADVRRVPAMQFDKVWGNLEALCKLRDEKKSDLIVGAGFVVTKDNWREIPLFAKRAKETGVDNIRFSAIFQNEGSRYFNSFFDEAAELCSQSLEMAEGKFTVFNGFGDRVADLAQKAPDYDFCGYQHFTTYIGGDLNVYRCCGYAYNERGLIGSLEEQTFKQLWASKKKKKDFDNFRASECGVCQFNHKNKAILYALDPNPRHVDFV